MRNLEIELTQLYKDVYCFVNSRIHDPDCAKDITQDVIMIAIDRYGTLRKKESLKFWVMQIASNKVKAYYNDLKRVHAMFVYQECENDAENTDVISEIADVESDILESIITKMDQLNLMAALSRLEKKYQMVLRLRYICEYSYAEISEIMHANVNTTKTWAARGLVKLKDEFERMEAGDHYEKA